MLNLSRKIKKIRQTKQNKKVSSVTDIEYSVQNPMMETILERQKILIAHCKDAKLVYLREQADNALKNVKQLTDKNIQIIIIDDILQAKHKNYKHYKQRLR